MYNQMMKLIIKIMSHISQDDSGLYPISTAKYNGKQSTKAVAFTPYGLYTNLPKDSTMLSFSALCQESNKYAIGQKFANRFKDLKEGEVVVGNAETGSFTHFFADGSIKVFSADSKTIEITKDFIINVGGDATISAAGNVQISAAGTGELTAASWQVNGIVTFSDTTIMPDAIISGTAFSSHGHPYTWTDGPGSGVSEEPQ